MNFKAESGFSRDHLKILLSSALKTDSEFLFMHIFYHLRCSIAHSHLIAEICL